MNFLLQKENEFDIDIDILTLKDELKKQKFQHSFINLSIKELDDNIHYHEKYEMEKAIPIGTIDFVGQYLKKFHNIKTMNPIEVPNELKLDKFLNRKYSIVEASEIPKEGYFFLKNASKLKDFTYLGEMKYFFYDEIFDEPRKLDTRIHLNKNHLYQVSEAKNILAEYRVYVMEDKIEGIQFYDGDVCIMPTPNEILKIKEMVNRYMLNNKRPKAYSLDIAIIYKNNEYKRDIMLLEIHPFSSIGLYGVNGSFLPMAYRHGVDWYIKYNTPIEKYKN